MTEVDLLQAVLVELQAQSALYTNVVNMLKVCTAVGAVVLILEVTNLGRRA